MINNQPMKPEHVQASENDSNPWFFWGLMSFIAALYLEGIPSKSMLFVGLFFIFRATIYNRLKQRRNKP